MTAERTTRTRFLGGVLLAAGVALTLPATVLVLGPSIGRGAAISLHWIAAVLAHAIWLAPSARRALVAGSVAALGALALVATFGVGYGQPPAALIVGLVGLVAITRSVVLHRVGWVRGLVVEALLGWGGLALAGLLAGPGLIASAASLWGFWLVQSAYPLLPGLRFRHTEEGEADPFERAASRLGSLLEDA